MRVALVHSYYSSAVPSGENTMVDQQIELLAARGHEVLVVARRTDEVSRARGYRARSAVAVATGRGASPHDELERFGPDVVHLHNTFPNLGTRWLAQWGRRTVTTLHNFRTVCSAATLFRDGQECQSCLTRPVAPAVRHGCYRGSPAQTVPVAIGAAPRGGLRRILTSSGRLIALNESMADVLRPLTPVPIDVVPNFVPHAPATPGPVSGWAYVGRLTEEKGIAALLQAWPEDQHLHVYGEGPLGEVLRERHHRADVTWHGRLAHDDLLRHLGRHRGLLVPSLWREGLPTVILEALALGVPVVVSDVVATAGPLVELGVAVPISMAGIAPAGVRVALDTVRARGAQLRQRCRTVHQEHYSPEQWAARVERVYAQLR